LSRSEMTPEAIQHVVNIAAYAGIHNNLRRGLARQELEGLRHHVTEDEQRLRTMLMLIWRTLQKLDILTSSNAIAIRSLLAGADIEEYLVRLQAGLDRLASNQKIAQRA